MTTVDGATATGALNPYAAIIPDAPVSSKKTNDTMSSDQFLKLLVAQLKYQDPAQAQDPSAFLAQTAQFTELETMQKIEKAIAKEMTAIQQAGAHSLLGAKVTGKPTNSAGAAPEEVTGVVKSVSYGTDGPILKVDNYEIPYASVKEVSG